MKLTYHPLFASIALLFMSFASPQPPKFQVEIIQNNQVVPIENNVAVLEKKEFKLRITLINQDGIYFNSSFNRNLFNLQDNQEITGLANFANTTRIEENFNTDKDMEIDDESVSYLFYNDSMDWHRFDTDVQIAANSIIGTKTVDKIYVERNKKTIPLDKMNRSIYLFFVATNDASGSNPAPKELGRCKIELRWK